MAETVRFWKRKSLPSPFQRGYSSTHPLRRAKHRAIWWCFWIAGNVAPFSPSKIDLPSPLFSCLTFVRIVTWPSLFFLSALDFCEPRRKKKMFRRLADGYVSGPLIISLFFFYSLFVVEYIKIELFPSFCMQLCPPFWENEHTRFWNWIVHHKSERTHFVVLGKKTSTTTHTRNDSLYNVGWIQHCKDTTHRLCLVHFECNRFPCFHCSRCHAPQIA